MVKIVNFFLFSRRRILNNIIFMNRLDMRFTVAFLSEWISAVGTLVWFFTRMNANMGLHEWWSFHYLRAIWARVLSITAGNGLDLERKRNFFKGKKTSVEDVCLLSRLIKPISAIKKKWWANVDYLCILFPEFNRK